MPGTSSVWMTIWNIFHMDINYLCFCCKCALRWIKRNSALDYSFIILFFLLFHSYVALFCTKLWVWLRSIQWWVCYYSRKRNFNTVIMSSYTSLWTQGPDPIFIGLLIKASTCLLPPVCFYAYSKEQQHTTKKLLGNMVFIRNPDFSLTCLNWIKV